MMTYKILAGTYPSTQQGFDALVNQADLTADSAPLGTATRRRCRSIPGTTSTSTATRAPSDPNRPEIISLGPDGEQGTSDDISNQDPKG